MKVSAKEFSQRTGFPLRLIRRMCRTGLLPHWQVGRVYLLDEVKALQTMEMYKAVPVYEPKPERIRQKRGGTASLPGNYSSRTEWLKEMLKEKTACAATQTVKAGRQDTCDSTTPRHIEIISQKRR